MHNRPPREPQPSGQRELPPCGERELQSCGDFAGRLVDLSDGELPAAEAAIVRDHCETCPACRLTLVRLDRSLGVLDRAIVASEPVASPCVKQPVESLAAPPVSRPAANHSAASRRGWSVAITASAAAAALLLAGLWLYRNPGGSTPGNIRTPQVTLSPPAKSAAPDNGESVANDHNGPEQIARQLALIEQVARLEASLAMTPDDPWFASQRASNERLLAGFRQAVQEMSAPTDESLATPSHRNEAL